MKVCKHESEPQLLSRLTEDLDIMPRHRMSTNWASKRAVVVALDIEDDQTILGRQQVLAVVDLDCAHAVVIGEVPGDLGVRRVASEAHWCAVEMYWNTLHDLGFRHIIFWHDTHHILAVPVWWKSKKNNFNAEIA